MGSLLLSPGSWCVQGSVCALQESVSPVLCKFWRLHGGVNGDLLQGGLCHTQVCCTQSPCPRSSPLLTRTSTGDTQKQVWLSLCGVSWCAQGFVCALQESISQSCKLWQLCGGVNGDLLQKGLCHTQVCCTQSPCSCGRPLLTCTSTGDTQTQFWLGLCGVSGSW